MHNSSCCVKTVVQKRWDTLIGAGIPCKRWDCPQCAPKKRKRIAHRAASGLPERFITPTVNPKAFHSPEDAAVALRAAWTRIMLEVRRKWPKVDHQYFCVFEVTKAGWPHLHVLYRGCFIPQKWLSWRLKVHLDSPIVDIRKVRSKKHATNYVIKYLMKQNTRLATVYRHSNSRRWKIIHDPPNPLAWKNFEGPTAIYDGNPDLWADRYFNAGWEVSMSGLFFETRPPPEVMNRWKQEPLEA